MLEENLSEPERNAKSAQENYTYTRRTIPTKGCLEEEKTENIDVCAAL